MSEDCHMEVLCGGTCMACGAIVNRQANQWGGQIPDVVERVKLQKVMLDVFGTTHVNRLFVENAHVFHRSFFKKERRDPPRLGTLENNVFYTAKGPGEKDAVRAIMDATDPLCQQCNSVAHVGWAEPTALPTLNTILSKKLGLFNMQDRKLTLKETVGITLAAQVAMLLLQLQTRSVNIQKKRFSVTGVLAYYTSLAMFYMNDHTDVHDWLNTRFMEWHQCFFWEMPLHNNTSHTLCDFFTSASLDDDPPEEALYDSDVCKHPSTIALPQNPPLAKMTERVIFGINRLYDTHKDNIDLFFCGATTETDYSIIWAASHEKRRCIMDTFRDFVLNPTFSRIIREVMLTKFTIMVFEDGSRANITKLRRYLSHYAPGLLARHTKLFSARARRPEKPLKIEALDPPWNHHPPDDPQFYLPPIWYHPHDDRQFNQMCESYGLPPVWFHEFIREHGRIRQHELVDMMRSPHTVIPSDLWAPDIIMPPQATSLMRDVARRQYTQRSAAPAGALVHTAFDMLFILRLNAIASAEAEDMDKNARQDFADIVWVGMPEFYERHSRVVEDNQQRVRWHPQIDVPQPLCHYIWVGKMAYGIADHKTRIEQDPVGFLDDEENATPREKQQFVKTMITLRRYIHMYEGYVAETARGGKYAPVLYLSHTGSLEINRAPQRPLPQDIANMDVRATVQMLEKPIQDAIAALELIIGLFYSMQDDGYTGSGLQKAYNQDNLVRQIKAALENPATPPSAVRQLIKDLVFSGSRRTHWILTVLDSLGP